MAAPEMARAMFGKSMIYFNGAFSPPTRAHAHIIQVLAQDPDVDALWLDPEPAKPGKERWQDATLEARLEMCELMAAEASSAGNVGVGTLRRDLGPKLGESPELFRTLRAVLGGADEGKLCWALGADVFEGMRHWADKARACLQPGITCDSLLVFARDGWTEDNLSAAINAIDLSPCAVRVLRMPDQVRCLSSRSARRLLVAALKAAEMCKEQDEVANAAVGQELEGVMTPSIAKFCLAHQNVCSIYEEQVACTVLDNPQSGSIEEQLPHFSGGASALRASESAVKTDSVSATAVLGSGLLPA